MWAVDYARVLGEPLVTAEAVYVNVWRKRHELVKLERGTGREMWSAGAGGWAAPVLVDGRLYANGVDELLVADPQTGKIGRRWNVPEEVVTSPVVAGELVVFGTIKGQLVAVER